MKKLIDLFNSDLLLDLGSNTKQHSTRLQESRGNMKEKTLY